MSSKSLVVIAVGFWLISPARAQQKVSPKTSAGVTGAVDATGAILATPANCVPTNATPQLNVQPDGTVVVTRSDGHREIHAPAKLTSPRSPALPDVNKWLSNHAEVLLQTIESIAGPNQVHHQLQWESGSDMYEIIAKRTETLRRFSLYLKGQ